MNNDVFIAEYGFMPNSSELRIANGRDPLDEAKPFTDGNIERYPRAWRRRGQALKAEGGTRHLAEPNVYPASKPSNRQPITLADVSCRHRGQPIAEIKCRPCTVGANRDIMVPVCRCELHNTHCTAANTGETYEGTRPRGCSTCPDREAMTAGTLPVITKRLTVGFATRQDSCRARWVIQTLREMHGPELAAAGIAWEIVIVDNGGDDELAPDGQSHTAHLRAVANANPDLVRLISFAGQQGTFPPKAEIFNHAVGEIVLVIDSHVMIRGPGAYDEAGALLRLVHWFEDDFDGIVHGPILGDGWTLLYTHEEREYRDNMLAQWDNYDHPTLLCTVPKPPGVFGEREVEIPQAGAWLFACRRDAWPRDRLPKGLRGFGGDENIDRLFQVIGRKVLCLEWLAGWHDFYSMKPRYVNDPLSRLRNDCLWHLACGDTYRIVEALEHYKVTDDEKQSLLVELGLAEPKAAKVRLRPIVLRPSLDKVDVRTINNLKGLYELAAKRKSDINEHVPTLRRLAVNCEHVVEFGTRDAVSTTALAASGARHVLSVDVSPTESANHLMRVAPNVKQIIHDTLTLDRVDCDGLFIDTLHTSDQVFGELSRHSPGVRKWLALHDTEAPWGYSDDRRSDQPDGGGVRAGITRWKATEEGRRWNLTHDYRNNHGLAVFQRAPEKMKIPILISFRDRVTWCRRLAEWCRDLPDARVIVCDNDSGYGPAKDWLVELEANPAERIEVYRIGHNGGPRSPFSVPRDGATHYVVTDQDQDLTGCPRDILDVLRQGLDAYPNALKAGTALRIDDLPDTNIARLNIEQEEGFWTKPFTDGRGHQWYDAPIDMTFAMYREHGPQGVYGPAIRLGGAYQARHLSVYLTPETLTEEDKHYLKNGSYAGLFYSPLMLPWLAS